jgi:hypothetical protein
VQDILAHFICTESTDQTYGDWTNHRNHGKKPKGVSSFELDAGVRFKFQPLTPTTAYTADLSDGDRIFALESKLLLHTPQDLLGNKAEIALVCENFIKWSCFKKIHKRPLGVWVAKNGADLYEYHYRMIFPTGQSEYYKRLAAVDKNGNPVLTIIEGTHDQCNVADGQYAVLASSIIEDAHRPGTFKATVTDSVGLVFPVQQGHHLDVFKLRDGPFTGTRKRPLLHWVAKHLKRNRTKEWPVSEHLRGIHEFSIDGMKVKLEGSV